MLLSTQLRPVTYKAICDLTQISSSTYGHHLQLFRTLYDSSGPPACGRRSSRPKAFGSFEPGALLPFRASQGTRAFTVATTSCANILRGSAGSACRHWFDPSTQTTDTKKASTVPRNMINKRGGNDFLSG